MIQFNESFINIIIIVIIIYFIINYSNSIETYKNKSNNYADLDAKENKSYDIASNCKPDYCNNNVWGHKVDIPKDYEITNFSTSEGCCITPIEYKSELNKRFGNESEIKNKPNDFLQQFEEIFSKLKK